MTHSNPRSDTRTGLIAALIAYCIWGMMPLYWRGLSEAGSVEILCHRIVWSLFFILLALAVQGKIPALARTLKGLARDLPQAGFIFGATSFASANWLINIVGVNTGRVVELGIGMFLTPLATVALGMIFFRERLEKTRVAAVALAAAGVVIMIWNLGRIPWIALGVSSTWAIYGAFKKKVTIDPWSSTAAEHMMMFPFALAALLWLAASGTGHFLAGGIRTLDLMLLGTGVMTSIPMIAFSLAAQKLPLIYLGFVQYLNPILTTLLGVLWFREPIGEAELVPLAFIWAGIALYLAPSLLRSKERKQESIR